MPISNAVTSLGILPARRTSQRFPAKHHVPLLGKPMFAYTIEAALRSARLTRLVISSDDLELRPLAERYGVEFIERPAELASVTAALDDALRHACRTLRQREGFEPVMVVAMLGNVPVRKEGRIDEVIGRLEELPDATAVCTAEAVRQRPEWWKVMPEGSQGHAVPFLTGHTAYRTQDYPPLYRLDGAVSAVRTEILLAQEWNRAAHAWFGDRLHLVVQEHPRYSLEVDYPEDAALAEFYLLTEEKAWVAPSA